ncbi:MAG: hypothetical protein HY861_02100 [Chlamydiia bacterium]|nr:hypothetical protein [Chlamydiia bacterium]
MSDEELLQWNACGLIPGPSESEEEFVRRVSERREIQSGGEQIPRAHWDWTRLHLKRLFGFEPALLPAFYSNTSLVPWQGAATWIEGKKVVSIQLREGLRCGRYLGYSRDEILAHEAVHAARSAFAESKTEEFFAYMTSDRWWRRAFGPIVRHPWEVWVLLLCLIAGSIVPAFHLMTAVWIGGGLVRLIHLHIRLRRAGDHLLKKVNAARARAILFRLTDAEIQMLARGGDVVVYAQKQTCLRWRLIRSYLYPFHLKNLSE